MITKKDVKHIANLARIKLTGEEEQKMEKELSAILGFVEKLDEVNTENVEPMAGGTVEKNITRADEQINKILEGHQAGLLNAVPDKKEGWVRVKSVFHS